MIWFLCQTKMKMPSYANLKSIFSLQGLYFRVVVLLICQWLLARKLAVLLIERSIKPNRLVLAVMARCAITALSVATCKINNHVKNSIIWNIIKVWSPCHPKQNTCHFAPASDFAILQVIFFTDELPIIAILLTIL